MDGDVRRPRGAAGWAATRLGLPKAARGGLLRSACTAARRPPALAAGRPPIRSRQAGSLSTATVLDCHHGGETVVSPRSAVVSGSQRVNYILDRNWNALREAVLIFKVQGFIAACFNELCIYSYIIHDFIFIKIVLTVSNRCWHALLAGCWRMAGLWDPEPGCRPMFRTGPCKEPQQQKQNGHLAALWNRVPDPWRSPLRDNAPWIPSVFLGEAPHTGLAKNCLCPPGEQVIKGL